MFGGNKSIERRREDIRLADQAADHAVAALAEGDVAKAKVELSAAPKKLDFADIGWKVAIAQALIDLAQKKRRAGVAKLVEVCARLDDTSLSRDDKGYLRLFALYRAIEASRNGKAPRELRQQVESFRFDHTLVSAKLRERFPLKAAEAGAKAPPPPPKTAPPSAGEDDPF